MFSDWNDSGGSGSVERVLAKLRLLEEEVRVLTEAHQRLSLKVEDLRAGMDTTRFEQQRTISRLDDQERRLLFATDSIQSVLRSNIWKGLVYAAGIILRLPGARNRWQPSSPAKMKDSLSLLETPAIPIKHPDETTHGSNSSKAHSCRHNRGGMTLEQWARVIRTISGDVPASSERPKISIITPTWNTKVEWFAELAISILEQTKHEWEWCIVDDCSSEMSFQALFGELTSTGRVRVIRLDTPHGISGATNRGLSEATGEYVCFVDHDDLLTPDALATCLSFLTENDLDVIYTDSDKIDSTGTRREPFFKPDWSPEYFRGVMYIGHLLCLRRSIATSMGGFASEYDGVQDYEFMLRVAETTSKIGHIPKITYHWRATHGSVAADENAKGNVGLLQRRAVEEHLRRLALPAIPELGLRPHRLRIVPKPRASHPLISIIIPTKDAPHMLGRCIDSIYARTHYKQIEVICVDNDTTDPKALQILRASNLRRILFPGVFNYSRANNVGVNEAAGEFLVFMNNDIEVITPNWIEELLYYAEQPDVGAVGGLLLYPDRSIQHAGVVLGCRGTADHVMRGAPADTDGYAGSVACAREVSAVTAACMMMRRSLFESLGRFNEHFFTAYQDVDLCLRARTNGLRNVYTPHAAFFHHESYSRGKYYDFVDRNLLLDLWAPEIETGDPYYNPSFDVGRCDYSIRT